MSSTFEDLWRSAGCPGESLEPIAITGCDPVLPSPFKIGETAAAVVRPECPVNGGRIAFSRHAAKHAKKSLVGHYRYVGRLVDVLI